MKLTKLTKFNLKKYSSICFVSIILMLLTFYVIGLTIRPRILKSDEISVFGQCYSAILIDKFNRKEVFTEEMYEQSRVDTLKIIDSKSYFAGPIAFSLAAILANVPSNPDCQPVDGTRSVISLGNDTILNTNCSHYEMGIRNQVLTSLIRFRFGDAFQRVTEFKKDLNCYFCPNTK